MENIQNTSASYYRNKIAIIIIAVVAAVIASPAPFVFGERSSITQIINIVIVIALNLLTFAWCYYDSLERNETFGRGWGFLILLLGFFALAIYLFKSRGFKRGLISVGKSLLILLGVMIGSFVFTYITVVIRGT